jgi:hypothetical protein
MSDVKGRGLWENETAPVVAQPDLNLGNAVKVTPQMKPQVVLKSDGSSIYSWTLTCDLGLKGVRFPESAQSPKHGAFLALVTWGQGGTDFEAEIDVKEGAQFTVVATSIKVSAVVDPDEPQDDGLVLEGTVNAAIVWGTRPGRSRCTRTKRVVVPDGGEVIVAIPNFAESLVVMSPDPLVMNGTTNPITLTYLGGPDTGDLPLLSVTNAANFFTDILSGNGLQVPGGARFLKVANTTGAPQPLSLVWELSL